MDGGNNREILPVEEIPAATPPPPPPAAAAAEIPPPPPAGGEEAAPLLPADANPTEPSLLRVGGDKCPFVGRDDAVV